MINRPSADESIRVYFDAIHKSFEDVFNNYKFELIKKTVDQISYENDCFMLIFEFEYNQYGLMLFEGISIYVKKAEKRYWLGHVLRAIKADKNFDFEGAIKECIAQSSRDVFDIEANRKIWDPYIAETFKDCAPAWEADALKYSGQK